MDAIEKGVKSFFSSQPVTQLAEQVHERLDPDYEKAKGEMSREADKYKMMAAAVLAGSVFFAFFGMLLCVAGSPFLGVTLELITLPLAFISYNVYTGFDNLKKIALNPKAYSDPTLDGYVINKEKFMNCLLEGTICMDGFAKRILEDNKKNDLTRVLFGKI